MPSIEAFNEDGTMRPEPLLESMVRYMIPGGVQDALMGYLCKRLRPGTFTSAVLRNDLKGALASADVTSEQRLKMIVSFLYNEVPEFSWGSAEAFEAWIAGPPVAASEKVPDEALGPTDQATLDLLNRLRRVR